MNITLHSLFLSASALLTSVVFAADLSFDQPIVPVKVAEGQDLISAEFPFTNKTKTPITVKSIKVACDCTSASLNGDKKVYQPGESGIVKTTMKTGNFAGITDKTLTVKTDQGETLLTIRADIPEIVVMTPRKLVWKKGSTPKPQVITINIVGPKPIKLTKVGLVGEDFEYDPVVIEPGRKFQITITPKSTTQSAFNTICVETDAPMARDSKKASYLTIK